MNDLGVICGLTPEADCLGVFPADQRPSVRCSGARTQRAFDLARQLTAEGCRGLLSFGTAGGLTADLKPGAVVIPQSVAVDDGRVYETSEPWRDSVLRGLADAEAIDTRTMASTDAVVTTVAAKRALAAQTDAVAVDMESHAGAAAAEEAGVPFLGIRAVADPVGQAIPDWVLGNITEAGDPRYGAILAGLLKNPWDLPTLIGLAGDNGKAITALRRVAGHLGPSFGLE